MHIGNAYAMLAAWLGSRSQGEGLLLRIEDIDTPRVVPDADRWIMDDLHWLGLDWQGDPVYQSQRTPIYEQALRTLAQEPLAIYPCFCSRAEIRAASAPQEGDGFVVYPGLCRGAWERHDPQVRAIVDSDCDFRPTLNGDSNATNTPATLSKSDASRETQRHALRYAVPEVAAEQGRIEFDDLVYGAQHFDLGRDLGDTVVRRSDGLFAYQLAVTVDDLLEDVNQIVRGRDLLRSTALQLNLRANLVERGFVQQLRGDNATVTQPQFAHLPLVDNAAGVRLAKRTRSLDLGYLRSVGVRPEQVIGWCAALLGLDVPGVTYDNEGHIDPQRDDFRPAPISAHEALDLFSWQAVRDARYDKAVPHNLAERLKAI
ncbi:tRNA ligase class I (E and Q), catalytic domain protein [Bifidobacterium gallicum DSM 20093 = LMG 11596]|nr:tRNA ligase class I (E and Q), catalytic domain protein [Bifidobacterium gallicum DSM 20093 = LMG 11596]